MAVGIGVGNEDSPVFFDLSDVGLKTDISAITLSFAL
jgi:hypothetical protein